MTEEKHNPIGSDLENIPLDDLERLVRGIEHSHISDLVKSSTYLPRYVFPGYRPDHLPWDKVPVKLARYAHDHPEAIPLLVKKWLVSNHHLYERVQKEISPDTLEEGIAKVLASLDHDKLKGDRLLWALLLDKREEIQAALADGLRDALTRETSSLTIRADRVRLASQLEKAEQEIRTYKERLSKLEERDRLLNRKIEHFNELQDELQLLKKAKKDDEARSLNEIRQMESTLQTANEERDTAQKRMKELQATLDQEQAHTAELQKQIDNLRVSLETAIASRDESTNETERRLDETLKLLEDQRRENTSFQQRLNRAERDKVIAYEKRDEERDLRERIESRLEKLEIDKHVLIGQRREDHKSLKQLKDELDRTRRTLAEKAEASKLLPRLIEIDEAWNEVIKTLAEHLALALSEQAPVNPSVPLREKVSDWQTWQQTEAIYVYPLLATPLAIAIEDVVNLVRAQKLLALRWYILECLKLSLTEALSANNRGRDGLKQKEQIQ